VTTYVRLLLFNQPAQQSLVLHSAEKLCLKSGKLNGHMSHTVYPTSETGHQVILNSLRIQCYALHWTGKNDIKIQELTV